jgi:hypothetical protein
VPHHATDLIHAPQKNQAAWRKRGSYFQDACQTGSLLNQWFFVESMVLC